MAETNNHEEQAFPSKRKPDQDLHDIPNKTPKITTISDHSQPPTTANSSSNHDVVPNNDNEDDDDSEDSDAEPVVDRKGKGIMRDDKGKGKLIEEDDEEEEEDDDHSDDSDDDSDSDGNVSGSDSDFSDDPLAEVDLNNILPSRTRRRTTHPGLHIAGGPVNADQGNDHSDA
ncbi:uncharacterized protein [Cicer arietinum]|uniref:Transcription initiation factor TFIID subunit 11 n=1 Tax=Cicer arietinum TaxID=3827 RepID=A0A1S2XQN1_CICAR|nr:transcription initiation factor TFIID subunit 11 [Cicer arietinum]